jgi:hypothetical protein
MWKKSIDLATTIKLGTRVRHVEDGAEGRIVWANASAVKILWDDGEKVTWKRAELGAKGLVVIEQDEAAEQQVGEATTAATIPAETPEPAPAAWAAPAVDVPAKVVPADETPAADSTAEATPATDAAPEPAAPDGVFAEATAPEPAAEAKPAKKGRTRKPKAEAGEKKSSALDGAAKVLEEEKRPMNTKELIGAMAVRGYWTSPGGKTPAATLYSAILRELETKGDAARFVKVGKGQFAFRRQA